MKQINTLHDCIGKTIQRVHWDDISEDTAVLLFEGGEYLVIRAVRRYDKAELEFTDDLDDAEKFLAGLITENEYRAILGARGDQQ